MSKPSEKAVRGAAAAVQELIDLGLIEESEADVFEQSIIFAFDEPTTELEAQHRKTWALAQQRFAHLCETTAPAWDGKSGFQSLKGYQPSKHAQQYADAARALPCPPIEATKDK